MHLNTIYTLVSLHTERTKSSMWKSKIKELIKDLSAQSKSCRQDAKHAETCCAATDYDTEAVVLSTVVNMLKDIVKECSNESN